ncbi:MAG: hypothetical protein KJ607_11480, partial [Bacteroidetes bacterium]|nr:hypothetical protein [Bacteroidota bacterium]
MAAILFSSCATDKPAGDLDVVSGIDLAAGLSDNEAIVFSLPSPFQMSATLKLLDLDYQESLIEATNKKDQIYTNSNINAMNMGINMIDLAYVIIYEEYSTSLTYLTKLDRMLEELGYGALKDPGLKARIDANFTNQDSLRAIANDVLKKAQVALSETGERKIPVLTVCGLYVE